jgi:hypothetical protein
MDEPLTLSATEQELNELAAERAQATGHAVAICGFTGSRGAHVVDLGHDGRVTDSWRVRVADRDEPEAN